MTNMITAIIAAINPSALPLVAVILGCVYLYFKFKKVEDDRKVTKVNRDADSQSIHDDILSLKFKVSNLEEIVDIHKTRLESIDDRLNLVNQELVKLNCQVEHLVKALEDQNKIMQTINNIKKE